MMAVEEVVVEQNSGGQKEGLKLEEKRLRRRARKRIK
jgi:hypothetical protein